MGKGKPGGAAVRSYVSAPSDEQVLMVSVCCTSYNHERFISQCLDGVLAQKTSFPFEILVHDDASTDGTAELIRGYAKRHPHLVKPIFQVDNQYSRGRSINPEFNFLRAKGKYIAICEGDDVWVDPLKLQAQVDFLEANPSFALCFTDAKTIDESGKVLAPLHATKRDLSATELQLTASIFTLTACFRHVFEEWPREFANVRYGDLAIWSMLGDHGAGKYMGDIGASLYRRHRGGLHSAASLRRRRQMALETAAGLYSYRLRIGQQSLADRHLEDVFVHTCSQLGVCGFWKMARRAFKHYVNRIFR